MRTRGGLLGQTWTRKKGYGPSARSDKLSTFRQGLVSPRLRIGALSRAAGAAGAVTGLAAFAPGFSGKARVLREAALLIRHALATLTTSFRRQLPILGEAAFGTRNALTTFASRLGRQPAVLREAAFCIRNSLTTHAGDLPLPFHIH